MGITDSGETGWREEKTHRIRSLSLLAERVCALLFTYWYLCVSFALPEKINLKMVRTLRFTWMLYSVTTGYGGVNGSVFRCVLGLE